MTAPHKIVCHASGEKCLGCKHYQGQSDVCEFAPDPQSEVRSESVRTATLWFEQQIENAKQDQISGFRVGPLVRGERAHARHCALYEAQQIFLEAIRTPDAAQEAKHCGASELERMERHKDILARALLLAQQEREIPLVAAAIKQAARHAGRDDAQSVDVESYLKEATIEECAAIASRYEGWQAENIAAQIRALALPSAAAPAQAGPDPLTRRERAEMIWAVLKSYMLDECSFDCAAVSPADEKNLINEIYNSIPNYSVPSASRGTEA